MTSTVFLATTTPSLLLHHGGIIEVSSDASWMKLVLSTVFSCHCCFQLQQYSSILFWILLEGSMSITRHYYRSAASWDHHLEECFTALTIDVRHPPVCWMQAQGIYGRSDSNVTDGIRVCQRRHSVQVQVLVLDSGRIHVATKWERSLLTVDQIVDYPSSHHVSVAHFVLSTSLACGVPLLIARTSKATGVQQGNPIEPAGWTSSIRKHCSAQEILSQLSDFEPSHNKAAFRRSSHSCHLQTSRMPLLFFDADINVAATLQSARCFFDKWQHHQIHTQPNISLSESLDSWFCDNCSSLWHFRLFVGSVMSHAASLLLSRPFMCTCCSLSEEAPIKLNNKFFI